MSRKTTNVLLVSEAFVREQCTIDENLSGKYLLPAIREAQFINLREIIGTSLLDKLTELVRDRAVEEEGNEPYADLLDRIQFFLAYQTAARVTMNVSYKTANKGVVKTSDDRVENASYNEVIAVSNYNQAIADSYALRIQDFIWDNRPHFPELKTCDCRRIRANLYSAATCGIFLGGARGKKLPRQ